MVVMEGTGGYEYLLLKGLAAHKLDAAVINPRRVRDFAKGIGLDAKTDPIDAQVITKYAEVVVPKQSIKDVLEMLKKQPKSIDSRLATLLQADEENKRTIEILYSVKGVGPGNVSSGCSVVTCPKSKCCTPFPVFVFALDSRQEPYESTLKYGSVRGRPAMAVPTAIQKNPGFGSVEIHASTLSKKEFKKVF